MRIQSLAFLLCLHSIVSCQQGPKNVPTAAAALDPIAVALNPVAMLKEAATPAHDIVFQSADGGLSWQDVSAGLPNKARFGRATVIGDQLVLMGSEEHALYQANTAAAAPIWERHEVRDVPIGNMAAGKDGPYLYHWEKGIFREIPGTGVVHAVHGDLPDKKIRCLLETPAGALLAGCETGLFKSNDGGKTWKMTHAGMPNSLSASDGVLLCGFEKGLLRSLDGGENWEKIAFGEGSAYGTVAVPGGFVCISEGGPWSSNPVNKLGLSLDGGKTWQRIEAGLFHEHQIHDIASAGGILFCSHDAGISRSADGGKTWELVRNAPAEKTDMFKLSVSGNVVFAILTFGC